MNTLVPNDNDRRRGETWVVRLCIGLALIMASGCQAPVEAPSAVPPTEDAPDPAEPEDTSPSPPADTPTDPPPGPVTVQASGVRVCPDPSRRETAWFDRVLLDPEPLAAAGQHLFPGSGIAVADLDGDGRLDVFSPGERVPKLYFQTSPGTFEEDGARLAAIDLMDSVSVSVADPDADGDLDLYVTRYRLPPVFLENDGKGNFQDATARMGLEAPGLKQFTSTWGDMDQDGDIDLFVGSYGPTTGDPDGVHPSSDPSMLFVNEGGQRLERRTELLPPEVHDGYTFMASWVDLDLDRDLDLMIVNDFGPTWPQRLVWNTEDGLVLDDGSAGLELPITGMGLATGDINGDEIPDLLISAEYDVFVMESRDGAWFDTTAARGIQTSTGLGTGQRFGWGAELFDVDNDGDMDAFAGFGPQSHYGFVGPQRDALWIQDDDGLFQDQAIARQVHDYGSTRGTVVADLNDDGWPDLIKRILDEPTTLHLSRCGEEAWLRFRLRGDGLNTYAIGARIRVLSGDRVWTRVIASGGQGMFAGQPPEALFGLGDLDTVDRVEILWPHGAVTVHEDIETRQILDVTWVGK